MSGEKKKLKAYVDVTLKKSVSDPQGQTVLHGLKTLGFDDARNVRVGKHFELELAAASKEEAEQEVEKMCESLLVNPVIEQYAISLVDE